MKSFMKTTRSPAGRSRAIFAPTLSREELQSHNGDVKELTTNLYTRLPSEALPKRQGFFVLAYITPA